jgi:hypothetical protein
MLTHANSSSCAVDLALTLACSWANHTNPLFATAMAAVSSFLGAVSGEEGDAWGGGQGGG